MQISAFYSIPLVKMNTNKQNALLPEIKSTVYSENFKQTQSVTAQNNSIAFGAKLRLNIFRKNVFPPIADILPESKFESKTLKKLFAEEFRIPKELNKDGYYTTSVIDNRTSKPVKVYVKRTSQEICEENSDCVKEDWGFFTKDKNGKYVQIGEENFEINEKNKKFYLAWINSDVANRNNGLYSGLGLRQQQLAIENAIQRGFDTIELITWPGEFPFHYKCGYRYSYDNLIFSKGRFNSYAKSYSKYFGIDKEIIKRIAGFKEDGDNVIMSPQNYENFLKYAYLYHPTIRIGGEMRRMALAKEGLETWKQLIKLQPIIS